MDLMVLDTIVALLPDSSAETGVVVERFDEWHNPPIADIAGGCVPCGT
jgi:hypothetical protein